LVPCISLRVFGLNISHVILVVHLSVTRPGWYKIGIDKDGILAKLGIIEDPPEPVIDAVVDQVFNGKSGMIYIPKHHQRNLLLRFWPRWAQDLKFGLVGSKV
jgi:all-trans-retinol dehydrogenase (NAD+)